MIFKQCISILVCISLLSNQMLFAGSLDLDKSASQKTSLDTAPNGVPIVNITTPNAQGLSHNKFTNYNVDSKGLILNNSNNIVQTQLAGFIASNPNLGGSSAKVILNEVTGTSRSLLNGYTEVAGSSADVIVANPNGISINGGGFINTPKVTLSTGKPELLNGQVGFNVSGGDIRIEGDGFNASANSQVDLYSKVLTLNAKLYAQNLNIVTGENQIASDGTITSKQAVGTGVSLDSSALGGIYAQRITLVGTDKGVGVNLPPEVLASNGTINISSDGKITFQKATASQSINAASTSSDIEIKGAVSAGENIALYAKETLTNDGGITAGLRLDGSVNTASTLTLQASTLSNNKKLISLGDLNVLATTFHNKGYAEAYKDLHVSANTLNNYSLLLSGSHMNLWISDLLYNYENANILALGNLVIAKDASLAKTKRIVNDKATIETINGDIDIYAETFENKTDGLVKGKKLVKTEEINANPYTLIDDSFIMQTANELWAQGKDHISIGNEAQSVCISMELSVESSNCLRWETHYGGIPERFVKVLAGYTIDLSEPDPDIPEIFRQHRYKSLYDINYISIGDMITALNKKLAKFDLIAVYRASNSMEAWITGNVGFFYDYRTKYGGSDEGPRRVVVSTEQEYVISQTAPAKLLSGGKLSINANTITNYLSEISSNDSMKLTGSTLNNAGEVLYQIDTRGGDFIANWGGTRLPIPTVQMFTQTDSAHALIYSAKDITGNLATVNNIDIKSNQAPLGHRASTAVMPSDSLDITLSPTTYEKSIKLPTGNNNLFVVSTNPTSKYLVETNPVFTSFNAFVSSDYMISRLGYNADAVTKRLGDAFYENRLVRDSIFEQTGKRYLDPSITNDSDQFKYLMDNALTIKDDLKLRPYVSLSTEQIAALTKDIVWMEEREVDGQKVLVPVVYIANVTIERTTDNGAKIVAKGDINLNVENLTNQGDITADGDVAITASKNIYNEGGAISSADNMTLQANEGVYNISSELTAKALSISANTFQSDMASQDIVEAYNEIGSRYNQLLSESSQINVKDGITIKTANGLSLMGTVLNAGGALELTSTQGNIAISSKTHQNQYAYTTNSMSSKGSATHEIGSSITADSISMNSNALLVNASDVTAQNDMNINAQNIAITAGEDRVYNDFQSESKKKGFFGRGSKTSDTSDQKTVVSSTISAKNLNINTKSLSIQGSKLTADQAIIASEVIELISLKNSDYESHFSDKSDTMTRTIISKGHVREEVVPALIQVRNQLIINNKDVTNQLQTDNLVKTITSQSGLSVEQIKLVQAYAKSEEWNKQMTSLTGMGSIIIAAIVTVCTMGAGTGLVAAAMEGMNAAVQAAVQAAIQSMVVQATTSLVTAAITGNSPVLDASSLIKGAVTAGVLSYTSAVVDSSLGLQGVKPADMSYTQQLERGVANTVVKSTVNSAVYGTDFGDNLKMGLATDVSNLGFRFVGDTSMGQYLGEGNDYFKDGGIGKIALHSVVGGASAALMGGDVAAGAVAAGVNELASPLLEGIDDKRQQAISGLIGGIAAGAVGGEGEITKGQTIAQSATEYNRQLHQDEIDFINKNADKYAEQRHISPEQAKQELAQEALRITDSLWASMLGESNPEAKAFLTSNVESLASITKMERDNPLDGLSNIASNQVNLDFYRQNVYSGVQKDVATVYNDKAKAIVTTLESLDADKAKEIGSKIAKNIGEYIQKTPISQISNDLKDALYSMAEDVASNGKKLTDLMSSDPNEIAKVYNISAKDVETLRGVLQAESIIAIAGMASNGTLKKAVGKEILEDAGKSVESAVTKDVLKTAEKGVYDAKEIRGSLEEVYGKENVTSTTVVNDPLQRVNSNLTKSVEVVTDSYGNKAVKIDYIDSLTEQVVKANIPYDSIRGLPIFDDVAKYTTNINDSLSYNAQMKQATLDLKDAINSGKIDSSKFTSTQLEDILTGSNTIEGYTWHHNAQSAPNNMQLVPQPIHDAVKHIGQGSLSGGK